MQTIGKISLALSAMTLALAAQAQIGPDPTEASLTATAGPFATASTKVAAPSGYGGGTVWYPTAAGKYGVVAVAPGFTEAESAINWWGPRLASHGYVVVTIGTKTVLDQPESRGKQLTAALNQVVSLAASGPFAGKVDGSKRAVAGHSMGGGGTLAAARDNPTYKAALPLAPWHTIKTWSGVKVPTMIIACQNDIIAPVGSHAKRFYDALPATTPKGYLEIAGEDHFCVNSNTEAANKAIDGKIAVAWLKVFMDADSRYTPFLKASSPATNLSSYLTSGF